MKYFQLQTIFQKNCELYYALSIDEINKQQWESTCHITTNYKKKKNNLFFFAKNMQIVAEEICITGYFAESYASMSRVINCAKNMIISSEIILPDDMHRQNNIFLFFSAFLGHDNASQVRSHIKITNSF